MPARPVGPADRTGVVIFFACLDLKQKSSFMYGHELKKFERYTLGFHLLVICPAHQKLTFSNKIDGNPRLLVVLARHNRIKPVSANRSLKHYPHQKSTVKIWLITKKQPVIPSLILKVNAFESQYRENAPRRRVSLILEFKCGYPRSGFKTSNPVQSQGGVRDSSAGIYLIFRVLNPSVQHRNWALGEILKPLLIKFYVLVDMSGDYTYMNILL
jgi:hypothetical protein